MKPKSGFFISGQGLDYWFKKDGNDTTLTSRDLELCNTANTSAQLLPPQKTTFSLWCLLLLSADINFSGQADERMLVSKPVRKTHSSAYQKDFDQN